MSSFLRPKLFKKLGASLNNIFCYLFTHDMLLRRKKWLYCLCTGTIKQSIPAFPVSFL